MLWVLKKFQIIWFYLNLPVENVPTPCTRVSPASLCQTAGCFFILPAQWCLYSSLEIRRVFKVCELTKGEHSCSFYPLPSPPNLPPPTVISLPVLFGKSWQTPRAQQLYTHHPQISLQNNKALACFIHSNYGNII